MLIFDWLVLVHANKALKKRKMYADWAIVYAWYFLIQYEIVISSEKGFWKYKTYDWHVFIKFETELRHVLLQ